MADLHADALRLSPSISASLARLATPAARTVLGEFEDVSCLVVALDELREVTSPTPKQKARLKALSEAEHHLRMVRNSFLRAASAERVYLGASLLEDVVFDVFRAGIADPMATIAQTFSAIVTSGPGLVIYPVHSFRVPIALDLGVPFNASVVSIDLTPHGVCVFPQSNSLEGAMRNIQHAAQQFGAKHDVPRSLFEHWRRSRPVRWLEDNPLLVAAVNSLPGDYYENQFALVTELQLATTLVYGWSVLGPDPGSDAVLNTRIVNNHSTLDLRHYIALHPPYQPSNEYSGQCVPVNLRRQVLAELSDLDVFVAPYAHGATPEFEHFASALNALGSAYVSTWIARAESKDTPKGRLARKLIASLRQFRRSFYSVSAADDAVVTLAAAFETLLTDNYSRGVGDTLKDRTRLAAPLPPAEANSLADEVGRLYDARCEVMHGGTTTIEVDLRSLRRGYCLCFTKIAANMGTLPDVCDGPVGFILGLGSAPRPAAPAQQGGNQTVPTSY